MHCLVFLSSPNFAHEKCQVNDVDVMMQLGIEIEVMIMGSRKKRVGTLYQQVL